MSGSGSKSNERMAHILVDIHIHKDAYMKKRVLCLIIGLLINMCG